jgi:hypothetical protein
MRFLKLFLLSYLALIFFDSYFLRADFPALYQRVRSCRVRAGGLRSATAEEICAAMDMACIWYYKTASCLLYSAATTYRLRRSGIEASMVIGAQQMPFKMHAWVVDAEGRILNDKPYITEIYAVVDRC